MTALSIFGYIAAIYIFLLLYFAIFQKALFCAWNRKADSSRSLGQHFLSIVSNGIKSDTAAAAYLTAPFFLTVWIWAMWPHWPLMPALIAVSALDAVLISLLTLADTVLYRFWKYKIDKSVLVYLRTPAGAFASVSPLYILCALVAVLVLSASVFAAFQLIGSGFRIGESVPSTGWWTVAWVSGFIFTAAVLFIFIRGLGHRPKTPSMVYHSANMFYNHAALNPFYSFLYSLTLKDDFKGRFPYIAPDEADRERARLILTSGNTVRKLLRTDRPDIILVIWESLCAHYMEALGGKPGVTPRLDALAREGLLFTRMDAAGCRTDIALASILSGCTGQPNTSLLKHTTKIQRLPGLPSTLSREGYDTTVIHGGNLNIMHKADYYRACGHANVLDRKDMPQDAPSCSWGVHDEGAFRRLLDVAQNRRSKGKPFFVTLQTLSSHEPYRVPFNAFSHQISNSFAYTDHCLGEFVDSIKEKGLWDNTLLIVLGDHGLNNTDEPLSHNLFPHIPMVWAGGALAAAPGEESVIMSQNDLAATLLGQMGIAHSDFLFSRDVFADTYTDHFSVHCYNNGLVVRDERGYTDFDNVSCRASEGADPEREHKGRTILQSFYRYLANL